MCVLQDQHSGKTIGLGINESVDLYYLIGPDDLLDYPPILASTISPMIWHSRLGHQFLKNLQCILGFKIKLSTLHCKSYQNRKHHCASFPGHCESTSSPPFELVHLDI